MAIAQTDTSGSWRDGSGRWQLTDDSDILKDRFASTRSKALLSGRSADGPISALADFLCEDLLLGCSLAELKLACFVQPRLPLRNSWRESAMVGMQAPWAARHWRSRIPCHGWAVSRRNACFVM